MAGNSFQVPIIINKYNGIMRLKESLLMIEMPINCNGQADDYLLGIKWNCQRDNIINLLPGIQLNKNL